MEEKTSFKIRQMILKDLEQAISLSYTEGWNQTENDWKMLLENPANICLVAENNNIIVGTATAACYSERIAWIGMVLVGKNFRGLGAGRMLMTQIIDKLKHIESIKLDATPAGQPLYQNLGFSEEHVIYRMTNSSLNGFSYKGTGPIPSQVSQENMPGILDLDLSIFGAERSYLLNTLLRNYPEKAFIAEKNNRPEGYIFGRDGSRFNYIGPVYCFSSETAISLISKALESLNEKSIALDVPGDKEELITWLESIGFVKQRQFMRMYLKSNAYPGSLRNQYLICGPEFG
jgi:predicted GNAT family N-acyltransferase